MSERINIGGLNIGLFGVAFVLSVGLALTLLREAKADFPGPCEGYTSDPYNCDGQMRLDTEPWGQRCASGYVNEVVGNGTCCVYNAYHWFCVQPDGTSTAVSNFYSLYSESARGYKCAGEGTSQCLPVYPTIDPPNPDATPLPYPA